MSFLIFFSVIVVLISFIVIKWKSNEGDLKKIPLAPGGGFFAGHFKLIAAAQPAELERKWSQMLPFGIFRIYYFFSTRVYITDPQAVKKVRNVFGFSKLGNMSIPDG